MMTTILLPILKLHEEVVVVVVVVELHEEVVVAVVVLAVVVVAAVAVVVDDCYGHHEPTSMVPVQKVEVADNGERVLRRHHKRGVVVRGIVNTLFLLRDDHYHPYQPTVVVAVDVILWQLDEVRQPGQVIMVAEEE